MQRKSLLHQSFEVGITLKCIGGLLEVVGGVALWLVNPSEMNELVRKVCDSLLIDVPHSAIAMRMLNASQKLADHGTTFPSLYLLSHGAVKIALVICLWMNKIWAYPLTIIVFSAFMAYQIHRFTHTHAWSLIALTIFDAVIVYLTWQEYQQQKAKRREAAAKQ
jgi:uncharacterized membrane protein